MGALRLPNRIVMAPLTRNRAPDSIPTPLMAQYYAQRANAGLLISEGTAISAQGQGYADVPGLYGTEQLDGWKRVTDAVHERKGRIVAQLWHVGRVSHVEPAAGRPEAGRRPRPITAKTRTYLVKDGVGAFAPTSEPRALDVEEIPGIVHDYRHAARHAVTTAGFDGVEVHARQRLPAGPVPQDRRQPAHATTTAARSRTAPACCWKSCARWSARSAAAAPACASRR